MFGRYVDSPCERSTSMARWHSRRDFLRAGGLVAGGLLGGAALSNLADASETGAAWSSGGAGALATPWDQLPIILDRIKPPTFPAKTFNIVDYGAKAGATDSSD